MKMFTIKYKLRSIWQFYINSAVVPKISTMMNKITQVRTGLFSNMNIVTRSCEVIMYFRIGSEREIKNSKIVLNKIIHKY